MANKPCSFVIFERGLDPCFPMDPCMVSPDASFLKYYCGSVDDCVLVLFLEMLWVGL